MKARRELICYFFYKITFFRLNKEKDDVRSFYVDIIYFFHEIVNFHNLEKANHTTHVIFVLHSAMKTHVLTNESARNIQIIYKL